MISVRPATDIDRHLWEKFLAETALDHHAHCWQWRTIIREVFGHTPYYLLALKENTCAGILPLFLVRSRLFGTALISVPYLNGGGIVARNEHAAQALLHAAAELKNDLGAAYLELRNREAFTIADGELTERTHKVASILRLSAADQILTGFPAKLRSQIKRPTKIGLAAESATAAGQGTALIEDFYSVFCRNMRDLGTPVYPRQLFLATAREFGDALRVSCVRDGRKPVAAGITITFKGHTEIPWASSLREYNSMSPNMLMYWEAIKAACDSGSTEFDFGRSNKDSGTLRFKQQWGAAVKELHWYYFAEPGAVPDVNPHSPKYRLLVSCWQRLPLGAANFIGPRLSRGLP